MCACSLNWRRTRKDHQQVLQLLKQSSVFESATWLGAGKHRMTSLGRAIPFVKASACGNDFLIIDGVHAAARSWLLFSRRICDRHQGVGADGVEWLFPASDADVQARLFNADGSEAEISGNGTRCVAAYICSEHAKKKL